MMTNENLGDQLNRANLVDLLVREMETLPQSAQACLASVAMFLVQNLSRSLSIATVDRGFSVPEDCGSFSAMAGELQEVLKPLEAQPDERITAAYLAASASGELVRALTSASEAIEYPDLLRICVTLGQADVRQKQVASGLWTIIADADVNDRLVQARRHAQQVGGRSRGAQVAANAQAWKREALDIAQKLDSGPKKWTRDRLATDIIDRLKGENLPGHKAVETWLKDEAEQPNGPLRSRARRKPA